MRPKRIVRLFTDWMRTQMSFALKCVDLKTVLSFLIIFNELIVKILKEATGRLLMWRLRHILINTTKSQIRIVFV